MYRILFIPLIILNAATIILMITLEAGLSALSALSNAVGAGIERLTSSRTTTLKTSTTTTHVPTALGKFKLYYESLESEPGVKHDKQPIQPPRKRLRSILKEYAIRILRRNERTSSLIAKARGLRPSIDKRKGGKNTKRHNKKTKRS